MSTPPPRPQGRPIAFFDVDKTITAEDTFLLLVREGLKGSWWRGVFFATFSPLYVGTAWLGTSRAFSKGASLWALTVGRGAEGGLAWTRSVIAREAKRLLLPDAVDEIRRLEAAGHEVVFVTASAVEWIEPLLEAAGLPGRTLIGSRVRHAVGGWVMAGPVCYGAGKIARIEEALGRGGYVWAKGYSDSFADAPMLGRCVERILVDPSPRHLEAYERALGRGGFRLVAWRSRGAGRRATDHER